MRLSITQRLTLLVALLSGAVLAPAGAALCVAMGRGLEARSWEKANAAALTLRNVILRQLDEDILVDFAGERIQFDQLRIPFVDWAVVRSTGQPEGTEGIFREDGPSIALPVSVRHKHESEGRAFAVASIPLVPDKSFQWNDIPEVAQAVISANAKGGTFLTAKSEISGNRNVLAAKWLYPDCIREISVTEAGEFIEAESEALADHLPDGMEITTPSGQTIREPRIAGWQAYNSELIAIVEGEVPNGETIRSAVNRLGEQHLMGEDGTVVRMLETSRLWVVGAHDVSADIADTRLLSRIIAMSGVLLWLLITAIAWQVTKRALRPVDEIVKQAESIAPSRLEERLPAGPVDDELSRITRTVNTMLDRIQEGYKRERQFTGDVSHELRNPLAKMLGEIDLALSRDRQPQEYREALGRLRTYAEGMRVLTESLLMLARLDGRLQELEIRPFDVGDLAVATIGAFPEDSAQRISLSLGESIGPIQAMGHRDLIRVLLVNLLDNALRYSPARSPVHLRVSRNAKDVRVEVEDEGPGIPEEHVALAFNRFERLEKSRSKRHGGVGLGLSIAKAIADRHGTNVTVSRGAKKGTVAVFTLPALNGRTGRG